MIKNFVLYTSKARVLTLSVLGVIYALFASFSYGYSYSAFFIFTTIIMIYTYSFLIININRINRINLYMILGIVVLSIINGLLRGDIIDPITISTSLVIPLTFSGFEYVDADDYRRYIPCCIVTFILVALQVFRPFLSDYNVNTLGFVLYMGGAFGFIWIRGAKKKKPALVSLMFMVGLMFKTDCRNAMIVMAGSIVLVFLPDSWYKNIKFFRLVYITALLYTIFTPAILSYIFSNPITADALTIFTEKFTTKTYGMNLRIEYYARIQQKLSSFSLFETLFGMGVNNGSGHNLLFQGLFVYGYIGTSLIFLFYIRTFEMAYRLVSENNDKIALGCFIALVGNILLQGADEYLICNHTCVILPYLMMGLIWSRSISLNKMILRKGSHNVWTKD